MELLFLIMVSRGRPVKFKKKEEMQMAVDAYFDSCWEIDDHGKSKQTKPYTIMGLANALGITRETLLQYSKKDIFSDTVKRAKALVHQYAEEQLYRNGQVTGAIFNLKNNYGWKDKSETDVTSKGESLAATIVINKPDAN